MTRLKKMAPIAAAAMLVSLTGQAQTLDTSGSYFRAGTGAAHKDVSRACYGLNGPGLKYRLGNECDIYGEFNVSGKLKKDGLEYSVNAMPSRCTTAARTPAPVALPSRRCSSTARASISLRT